MAYIVSFSSHLHLNVNKFNDYISENRDERSKTKQNSEAIKRLKVRKRETGASRHTSRIQRLLSFCFEKDLYLTSEAWGRLNVS